MDPFVKDLVAEATNDPRANPWDREFVEALVQKGVYIERERCARLAEAAKLFCETQVDGSAYDSVWAARANECYLLAERMRETPFPKSMPPEGK